ncbi:MAG: riboflavin synthase subunit alpha [Hahellaceae bacterium]|nr:riboflavin synthase subunit alpha [Hahellaceae bacterium]
MFTGIVEGRASLLNAERRTGLFSYTFGFPSLPANLKVGDSIAINGACLTVTQFSDTTATFDLMKETLAITTLGDLTEGDEVNYEPAARFGDPIGGHAVSGHIHTTATLRTLTPSENNLCLEFQVPEAYKKYIFDKGYITVAGASLTVGSVTENGFTVNLIPETLRITIFASLKAGDRVNLEIDTQTQTLVDTIERILPELIKRQSPST